MVSIMYLVVVAKKIHININDMASKYPRGFPYLKIMFFIDINHF